MCIRDSGWDVLYLGADVPTNRLRATIERTQPDLVVFSAQLLETAASLLDIAYYLHDVNIPLGYSGYIFGAVPDLVRRIPGHFLGHELNKTSQIIESLILNRPPVLPAEPAPALLQQAWSHFRERAGLIEAHVWQAVHAQQMCIRDRVSPGIDYAELPSDVEVEIVSLAGEVKEAVLWGGELRTAARLSLIHI